VVLSAQGDPDGSCRIDIVSLRYLGCDISEYGWYNVVGKGSPGIE
jgi:hypothetical protein